MANKHLGISHSGGDDLLYTLNLTMSNSRLHSTPHATETTEPEYFALPASVLHGVIYRADMLKKSLKSWLRVPSGVPTHLKCLVIFNDNHTLHPPELCRWEDSTTTYLYGSLECDLRFSSRSGSSVSLYNNPHSNIPRNNFPWYCGRIS